MIGLGRSGIYNLWIAHLMVALDLFLLTWFYWSRGELWWKKPRTLVWVFVPIGLLFISETLFINTLPFKVNVFSQIILHLFIVSYSLRALNRSLFSLSLETGRESRLEVTPIDAIFLVYYTSSLFILISTNYTSGDGHDYLFLFLAILNLLYYLSFLAYFILLNSGKLFAKAP